MPRQNCADWRRAAQISDGPPAPRPLRRVGSIAPFCRAPLLGPVYVANSSNSAIARTVNFGRKRRNSETAFRLSMRNRTAGGISRLIIHAVRAFMHMPNAEQPKDSFVDVFAMRVVELVRTAMRMHQIKKFGIGSRPRKKPLRAISCNDRGVRTVAPY